MLFFSLLFPGFQHVLPDFPYFGSPSEIWYAYGKCVQIWKPIWMQTTQAEELQAIGLHIFQVFHVFNVFRICGFHTPFSITKNLS